MAGQPGRAPWQQGAMGVPGMSSPWAAPPSAWAGHAAAYQPQDSMTQGCSDLLPSSASSTPAPPLEPHFRFLPFWVGPRLPWDHSGLSGELVVIACPVSTLAVGWL